MEDIKLRTSNNVILFLYQGLFDKQRNVDLIFESFTFLPDNYHIILVGFGELFDSLFYKSKIYSNIHVFGGVYRYEIDEITRECDIGFSFLEDTCLNHELALPNKFLSYLSNGIPVISNGRKQISNVITEYNSGILVDSSNITNLYKDLALINLKSLSAMKDGVKYFQKLNSWTIEIDRLLDTLKYYKLYEYL